MLNERSKLIYEELHSLAERRNKEHVDYLKQILLGASTFLGLIISLHKPDPLATFSKVVFVLGVACLALALIFLSITLSQYSSQLDRMYDAAHKEFIKATNNPNYIPEISFIGNPPYYKSCERFGYFLLFTAVLSLTIYVASITL